MPSNEKTEVSFREWKKAVRQFERSMGILDVHRLRTYEQQYEEEKQKYLKKLLDTGEGKVYNDIT